MAYTGKRILIVGGGNSAAEIAVELAGTGRVTLSTRGPMRYFRITSYNVCYTKLLRGEGRSAVPGRGRRMKSHAPSSSR